ncbi:alpha/beta hydrolase family protein [Colwellia echini]|uniref:Alpha/beta hydrolase n=1 Tax=Colwellia echini TaxID=1982103 RepID=A0ABY3MWA4_9GAMM|nr:alpha/beta hydrolase [Colwellia echini]TYK65488.1 alpha/beta hydrolase [Colwellia echini]
MKIVKNIPLLSVVLSIVLLFQSAWAHAEIVEKKLSITGKNYPIPAILTLPKLTQEKKYPIVIMLHGTASQKNEVGGLFTRMAEKLAKQNIASIRFDFAGSGESTVDYQLYDLESAVRDTVSVYNQIKAQKHIDNKNVHLIGFSQGGLIAQLTAMNTEIPVLSMVTWSSVAGDGVTNFKPFFEQFWPEAKENGFAAIKFPWFPHPLNFSKNWFEQVRDNTSLTQMASYQGALLAIAGDADKTVPWESSLSLIKGAKQAKASMYLIKNSNHLFNVLAKDGRLAEDQSNAEELLRVTTDYLSQQVMK